MKVSKWIGIVGITFALHAPVAMAATITQTVTFAASDFVGHGGTTIPVDPVQGTFTFTLDPALNYSNQAVGISASALNIKVVSDALAFDYDASSHHITIGGAVFGASSFTQGWDDFVLGFNIANLAAGGFFSYSQFPAIDNYDAHSLALQQGSLATTPIPPSLIMLSTGLLVLGAMRWRRRLLSNRGQGRFQGKTATVSFILP